MVEGEKKLEEYKKTLQRIIDKYLPKKGWFSVKDMNAEQLYYIASILSEKDEKKRTQLWEELEKKVEEAEGTLRQDYLNILSMKDKYDNLFKSIDELSQLKGDVNADADLEKYLNY